MGLRIAEFSYVAPPTVWVLRGAGRPGCLVLRSHHSCAVKGKSNFLPLIRGEALPFDASKMTVLGRHVLKNLPRVTACEYLL